VSRKKLPAIMFYPGDWMKDPAIRSCGLAARGLWFDMLCLMHESPDRGKLIHRTGTPVTPAQLARMVGADLAETEGLLEELEATGVFSRREEDGAIISRRMVSDETEREVKSAAGRKGAANRWNDGKAVAEPMADEWHKDSKVDATGMATVEYEDGVEVAYPLYEWKREIEIVIGEGVPKDKQRKTPRLRKAVVHALGNILPDHADIREAAVWLSARVAAYYASPEGNSEFHRAAVTWFEDGGYEESDEAWASRTQTGVGWEAIDAADK
jgi:hypothetical protein